jgi:hypothetical protein
MAIVYHWEFVWARVSAFPPVFLPVRIPRRHYQFPGPVYGESPLPEYPFVPLTDGGVYDNMGLEALIKRISIPGLDGHLILRNSWL